MARTTPDEAVPSTSRKQGAAGALAAAEPSARGRKQAGSRLQSKATAATGKRQQQQQQEEEELEFPRVLTRARAAPSARAMSPQTDAVEWSGGSGM